VADKDNSYDRDTLAAVAVVAVHRVKVPAVVVVAALQVKVQELVLGMAQGVVPVTVQVVATVLVMVQDAAMVE
jgi:hypothetical protein